MTTAAQTQEQHARRVGLARPGQLSNISRKLRGALAFELLTIVVNIRIAVTATGATLAIATEGLFPRVRRPVG